MDSVLGGLRCFSSAMAVEQLILLPGTFTYGHIIFKQIQEVALTDEFFLD
jgi:hypothetical protein